MFCARSAETLILALLYKHGNYSRAIAPLLSSRSLLRSCLPLQIVALDFFFLRIISFFPFLFTVFILVLWSSGSASISGACLFLFCFGRCLRFHPLFAVFLEHGRRRNEVKAWHETVKSEGWGGELRIGSLDTFLRY